MTRIFTNIITDLNKNPVEKVSSGILGAEKRVVSATYQVAPADTDILIIAPFPSSARIHSVEIYVNDATAADVDDLTLYSRSQDGTYTAVTANAYAAVVTTVTAGGAGINNAFTVAGGSGRALADSGQRIWEDAGFASLEDAPGNLWLGVTFTDAAAIVRIWCNVEYTQD